jgi:hypothetical protein
MLWFILLIFVVGVEIKLKPRLDIDKNRWVLWYGRPRKYIIIK